MRRDARRVGPLAEEVNLVDLAAELACVGTHLFQHRLFALSRLAVAEEVVDIAVAKHARKGRGATTLTTLGGALRDDVQAWWMRALDVQGGDDGVVVIRADAREQGGFVCTQVDVVVSVFERAGQDDAVKQFMVQLALVAYCSRGQAHPSLGGEGALDAQHLGCAAHLEAFADTLQQVLVAPGGRPAILVHVLGKLEEEGGRHIFVHEAIARTREEGANVAQGAQIVGGQPAVHLRIHGGLGRSKARIAVDFGLGRNQAAQLVEFGLVLVLAGHRAVLRHVPQHIRRRALHLYAHFGGQGRDTPVAGTQVGTVVVGAAIDEGGVGLAADRGFSFEHGDMFIAAFAQFMRECETGDARSHDGNARLAIGCGDGAVGLCRIHDRERCCCLALGGRGQSVVESAPAETNVGTPWCLPDAGLTSRHIAVIKHGQVIGGQQSGGKQPQRHRGLIGRRARVGAHPKGQATRRGRDILRGAVEGGAQGLVGALEAAQQCGTRWDGHTVHVQSDQRACEQNRNGAGDTQGFVNQFEQQRRAADVCERQLLAQCLVLSPHSTESILVLTQGVEHGGEGLGQKQSRHQAMVDFIDQFGTRQGATGEQFRRQG